MLNADITEQLKKLGGELRSDRDGSFWRFSSDEFSVELEPFQLKEKWGFDCALEHRIFSQLVNRIFGNKNGDFVCINWFQRIQADDESVEFIIDQVLARAFSIPIEEYISRFIEYIPEKSVPQLCHLASLAKEKDFLCLMEYQDGFKAGNRRGFVPMVSEEMIERAVNIALEGA